MPQETQFPPSRFGFGTYRVRQGDVLHRQSLAAALSAPERLVKLVDTSTTYTDGSSERLVGEVTAARTDVTVVTKIGYVQGEMMRQARARIAQGRPFAEMVEVDERCWHCLAPDFIEEQLTRSLERLGRPKVDVLLLHNPEYFLKAGLDLPEGPDHAEYYRRIRAAFIQLEREAERGRIGTYGISSNTFGDPKGSPDFTSLEAVWDLASELSPRHRFRVIQFPLNLFEPGAALEPNNAGLSVAEFARQKGIATLVNRPLNAFHGRRLIRLADFAEQPEQDFQPRIARDLDAVMTLEAAYGGRALVPARAFALGHGLRHNLARIAQAGDAIHWRDTRRGRIEPEVADALGALAAASDDPTILAWAASYREAVTRLLDSVSAYLDSGAGFQSRHLAQVLDGLLPELASSATLSQKTLRLLSSLPGIGCVLVGARRPEYVADLLAAARAPRIPEARALGAIQRFAETELRDPGGRSPSPPLTPV